MSQSTAWHAESSSQGGGGSVLMINNYHRRDAAYEDYLREFGMRLLDLETTIEEEAETNSLSVSETKN